VKPTKVPAAKASLKSLTTAKPTPAKTVAVQVPSPKKSATPNPAKSTTKPAQSKAATKPSVTAKPKAKPKK
jgi:hypothetical protein